MSEYRWNATDAAAGYDAAAAVVHPFYTRMQDEILARLPPPDEPFLFVDLGGGSGRLAERLLERWPLASAVVVDQSPPFLALAERRLARFAERALCLHSRLQDDWPSRLPAAPRAIVSMSAIHHLEPAEKLALYRCCFDILSPGGLLLNGDEVRDADDERYFAALSAWADHMRRGMAAGSIDPRMHSPLVGWIERNVIRFGEPKHSGDDCHESIAAQLAYFRQAGFRTADAPCELGLWALLRGVK
ncbi:MAG: class I SAM-dependent methyltransferase [Pirellulaceae bacterium]|nr:class I SAM-dependent methyltransferase [Pirellulaceae bacterium]